jgi:tRNA pseudouridine38-40 synthase
MSDIENVKGATEVALFRYALGIEYAGANYHGWQIQADEGVVTVQERLQQALAKIANHDVHLVCAGRTDTGVNGCYQVVHFDTPNQRIDRAWVMGTNRHLPDDIAVLWAKPVSDQFHARFSAQARRYRYLIYSAPVKPAILSRGVTWTHKSLDVGRMQSASRCLIGEHDFSSYRAVACQANSPVRTVHDLQVYKSGEIIVIDIQANAFLHHMVRNIAGVLMKIGSGEAEVEWAAEVLEAKDRRKGGVTAPPWGLYFCDVEYPEEFALPKGGTGPYFLGH